METQTKRISTYKKFALTAANDLHYNADVIKAINESDDDKYISNIMVQARKNDGKLEPKGGDTKCT